MYPFFRQAVNSENFDEADSLQASIDEAKAKLSRIEAALSAAGVSLHPDSASPEPAPSASPIELQPERVEAGTAAAGDEAAHSSAAMADSRSTRGSDSPLASHTQKTR